LLSSPLLYILVNSLFFVFQSLNTAQSELLTALLNDPQMNTTRVCVIYSQHGQVIHWTYGLKFCNIPAKVFSHIHHLINDAVHFLQGNWMLPKFIDISVILERYVVMNPVCIGLSIVHLHMWIN
jgi:hypothetical protein